MATNVIDGDVQVNGDIRIVKSGGKFRPDVPRSNILQETGTYALPLQDWFVWDSGQPLPATAASDDLGLANGTWGTSTTNISAGDVKATTNTRYARTQFQLPPEYVAGGNVVLRASAGMLTTVAGTSCTVDFEVYKLGRDSLVSGSDLVTTSAMTMNSLVFSNKDFTVTGTALSPGDWLDIRMTISYVDAATGTAVKPTIGATELLVSIQG